MTAGSQFCVDCGKECGPVTAYIGRGPLCPTCAAAIPAHYVHVECPDCTAKDARILALKEALERLHERADDVLRCFAEFGPDEPEAFTRPLDALEHESGKAQSLLTPEEEGPSSIDKNATGG